MRILLIVGMLIIFVQAVTAAESFTGIDHSGVYECQGDDFREGKYSGVVTLVINKEHSFENYGSYTFKLEVANFGTYLGEAVIEGDNGAIHFSLNEPNTTDHGTGLATFSKNANGKMQFTKYYFETEYKGGNHGIETCIKR